MQDASVLIVEEGGRGGVAEWTGLLASALAHAGWDVHLATARDHTFALGDGVTVHPRFPYVRGHTRPGRLIRRIGLSRTVNGLGHLLAAVSLVPLARRCAVVHVQGGEWPPLTAAQFLALRLARRPVVHTAHNTFERGERSHRRAHGLIARCSDAIVVHTEFDRRSLGRELSPKVEVIPLGEHLAAGEVDVEPAAARRRLGIDEKDVVALLFGQLRSDKGIRDLLLAAREVDGIHVVLAGSDAGGLEGAEDLLSDPRLAGRVSVRRGFVPDACADALFAAADVAVLPYSRASASAVLLLAYGHRRPVVAYPVGGLPEYVVDGRSGWLTDAADAPALARALRAVVAAGRRACAERGIAAEALAHERYGWDVIARRTGDLYRRLTPGKGQARGEGP